MHLHQDPILAREEEEEERKPSRIGEKKERDALMERGSLREGESFILESFSWPWPAMKLGGAAISWGEVGGECVGVEERVGSGKVRASEEGWAAKPLYIEGEGVGCLLIDWVGWEVASSLIVLVGRLACGGRI
jgi:hypothetical protein